MKAFYERKAAFFRVNRTMAKSFVDVFLELWQEIKNGTIKFIKSMYYRHTDREKVVW